MDFSYRTLCCHVKTATSIICGLELAVVAFVFITKIEHPLMICTNLNISTVDEISEGRGPAKLLINEERICSTYSLIVLFIIFHSIGNAFALMGIFVEQHRLILPVLALLPFNLLFCVMFFLSVIVSYFTVKPEYDVYFVCLIFLQFLLRIYEFHCARRLYWYLQQRSETFFAPQSAVINSEEGVFQF